MVQKIAGLDTRTPPDGEAVYLFSGLLVCNSCGGRMTRRTNTVKGKKYIYYHCPTGKKNGCTHPVMVREDDLAQCVLDSVKAYIGGMASLDELLASIDEEQINREEIARYKSQIADNEVKLEEARQFKATLYENYIGNLISKKDYRDLKSHYTEQAERAQEAIDRLGNGAHYSQRQRPSAVDAAFQGVLYHDYIGQAGSDRHGSVHPEAAVFLAVRFHQVHRVVLASHINANE